MLLHDKIEYLYATRVCVVSVLEVRNIANFTLNRSRLASLV